MPKSESLPSLVAHLLFFKERLERFAFVAHDKRATYERIPNSVFSLPLYICPIHENSAGYVHYFEVCRHQRTEFKLSVIQTCLELCTYALTLCENAHLLL